jgi:hypothetical protein
MPSFSNVFEKGYLQTTWTLKNNNRLAEEKFGFRKNLTTEKATYELINEIVSALKKTGKSKTLYTRYMWCLPYMRVITV